MNMKTINKQGRKIAIIAMLCMIAVFLGAEVSEAKTLQEVTGFTSYGEESLSMLAEAIASPEPSVLSTPLMEELVTIPESNVTTKEMQEETAEPQTFVENEEMAGVEMTPIDECDETTYAEVSGEGVNLRVAPGVTSRIKDCLPKGNPLAVISRKKLAGDEYEWCKVKDLETGETGFMYGKYVEEVSTLKRIVDEEKKEDSQKKVAIKNVSKKKKETKSESTKSNGKASVKQIKEYARQLCKEKYDWGNDQFRCLEKLWERESGWNPNCVYNGCYGIPQRKALPDRPVTKEFKENWKVQVKWGCEYIKLKYGKPSAALEHSNRTNWY